VLARVAPHVRKRIAGVCADVISLSHDRHRRLPSSRA
jgi:hypothetical protein